MVMLQMPFLAMAFSFSSWLFLVLTMRLALLFPVLCWGLLGTLHTAS